MHQVWLSFIGLEDRFEMKKGCLGWTAGGGGGSVGKEGRRVVLLSNPVLAFNWMEICHI